MAKKKKWLVILLATLLFTVIGLYFVKNTNQSTIPYSSPKPEASSSAKPILTPSATPVSKPLVPLPKVKGSFGVPILTYHFVTNNPNAQDKARDALEVPPDKFEEQMQYLSSNGYTPISLDTLFAIFSKTGASPAKPIVLTFDDGYIDFYTTVYPILRRFNFHAVSFIPTGLVGGGYYMNWDQIKEIQSSGLVTFEAHSVSHVNLTSLNYDAALKQLKDSKETLQSMTGYPVNFMAYPYGTNNASVQSAAAAAGYVGAVGTWYGRADSISMNMPRIKVSGFWNIGEFASRL